MKKVGFHTLGCKVNQYETQAMIEMFRKSDYEIVDFDQKADVYIINTCTVTSFGDKKSRKIIRRAQKANPQAVIAVVGCYSQVSPDEVEKIEGIDVIAGTGERSKIVELVEASNKDKKIKNVKNIMEQKEFEETGFIACCERVRAFIKIQEGCDNYCSYCIIPFARGPVRSRSRESILNEVNFLADNGMKEIVLTGIHLTSYGKELKNISLLDIIEELAEIPGLARIRLGSLEPNFITEEFVSRIKKLQKLCPHFHISLQSGSDGVLRRMNRKYLSGDYENKVNLLRENIQDVSVTTDVMAGFPGETDIEFRETYDFLDRILLSKTHVFKYSPRKGTPAVTYSGQVEAKIKEERSNLLLKLSEKKEAEFNSKFLGRTMEVFFENAAEFDKDYLEGHTGNFIRVAARAGRDKVGQFELVKIVEVGKDLVLGMRP